MPDISSLVSQAIKEATTKEVVEEKETPSTEKETVEAFIERMITEHPGEIISGRAPDGKEIFNEKTVIPGFEELNLGLAEIYGLRWGIIPVLSNWKQNSFHPHIIPTSIGTCIIRGFSRREWSVLQKKIIENVRSKSQAMMEDSGTDQKVIEQEMQMVSEELIAIAGTIEPDLNQDKVRSLPTGIVTYLANSIMVASGHDQNPLPPLPLK